MGQVRFEIREAKDEQFYFVLIALNGEVICTSEMYTTKQSAQVGIGSVVLNAPHAIVIDTTKDESK